ncbi:hypothetical protein H4O18_20005 [Arenibacter sp. BSSL-BM3]|uniref:Uncharacterized protein n=1 Tax=Arenibacter arenosicollis TaxID=2762274 RepID=A0ABR7QSX3_9FLAO|nr:hypothetical protein [Arenibacter arenosicollis]MBC8770293.1 hypothetical protein [Arenibacter arenosicollis]
MQYSRILTLVAVTYLVLSCLSCREPMGEQQGTTPPENEATSPKKEVIKKPQPEKVAPKSKNGQKSKTRDTLSPKIALS